MADIDQSPSGHGGTDDKLGLLEVAGAEVRPLDPALRRSLVAQRLATVSARDTGLRVGTLLVAGAASTSLALVRPSAATWVIHAVVLGVVLTSMFAAEHEAIHGSLVHSSLGNDLIGVLAGVACLAPFSAYRAFHFEHHRRSHAPGDSEPVFVVRNHLEQAVVVPTAVLGLCAILWWRFGQQVAGRGPAWTGLARRRGLELATGLAAAAALGGLVGAGVLWGWHLPLLLWGAPVGVYLVLAGVISSTEHYECDYGPGSDFATSRTILTGPLVRLCIWNANFHTAHHLVPAVPGRNLGRLHELIAVRYQHVEPTYRAYHAGMWKRISRGELPDPPPWVSEERPVPDRAPHAVAEPPPASPEMAGPAGRSRPTPT